MPSFKIYVNFTSIISILLLLSSCSKETANIATARAHSQDYEISSVSFRTMNAFFPTQDVIKGESIAIPTDLIKLDFKFNMNGSEISFQDALIETDSNALLIIHKGVIVYEQYLNQSTDKSIFIGWSMSKSILSILTGIALENGSIISLDDTVDSYVPKLKGTVFAKVSIRNLLQMRAGTSYKEFLLWGTSDVDKLAVQSIFKNEARFTDFAHLNLTQVAKPGDEFNYSTLTSSILGLVLEQATGKSLAKLTEQGIWQKAGMESNAYWLLDNNLPEGKAFGGGGFNASLRDFGRLGLIILQEGKINGTRIVSEKWVEESTTHTGNEPVIPKTPRGYGYQWWTFINTELVEAVGIHGQFISIDPTSQTVIVKMSYWPERGGGQQQRNNLALFNSIRNQLAP